jgi:hypothetical protein
MWPDTITGKYLPPSSILTGSGANPVPESSLTSDAKLHNRRWNNTLRNTGQRISGYICKAAPRSAMSRQNSSQCRWRLWRDPRMSIPLTKTCRGTGRGIRRLCMMCIILQHSLAFLFSCLGDRVRANTGILLNRLEMLRERLSGFGWLSCLPLGRSRAHPTQTEKKQRQDDDTGYCDLAT